MSQADSSNRYILLDQGGREVDLRRPESFSWGLDYILTLFRHLEMRPPVSGVIFYISYKVPDALPSLGRHVVLVILGDEFHLSRPYFAELGAVLRGYGAAPPYCDGWPTSRLQIAGLVQFMHKSLVKLKQGLQTGHRLTDLFGAFKDRTLHVPLGYFRDFDIAVRPVSQRYTDYSFMGSITEDMTGKTLFQKLLAWPKTLSRQAMLDALRQMDGPNRQHTTAGFESSVQNHQAYVDTLADTKISLVPRGTSYETYRFFEACKAGCVVICEPLPDTWFYRGHPGIIIRDWSRLPALVKTLLADETRLQALSEASLAYWRDRVSAPAAADHIAGFLTRRLPEFTRQRL